ncbi:MAG: universal stress protein [Caulobacteraceae bacterium]
MTFKTLLVHVEPDWGSSEALDAAVHLSSLLDAHLLGVAAEAFELPEAAFVDGELVQGLRDQIDLDLKSAEARFTTATAGLGQARATFVSGMDRPYVLMAQHARGADLVVARRTPSGSSPTNLCHAGDLVMETGLPVLLVPDGAAPLVPDRVLVAWKDHRECRRALADALPFLSSAKQVVLASICAQEDVAGEQDSLREVSRRLERQGVRATLEVQVGKAGSALRSIETIANGMAADLIVAGAYSHSPLREWMFGGVTQDLLTDCDRHVLLSR